MARGFENVCEILLNLATEGHEKSLAGAVCKREKKETKAESVLVDLKKPKLEQNFKTAAIATKRLTVVKIFTRLFCSEQVKASEKVLGKLFTSTIKKKRRSRHGK